MARQQPAGWLTIAAALAAMCVSGCGADTAPHQPGGTAPEPSPAGLSAGGQSGAQTLPGSPGASGAQAVPEQPPPHAIPPVALTEAVRKTCLVQVGQAFPVAADELAKLPDMRGAGSQTASVAFGPKLSVVCFWQLGSSPRSRLAALDLLEFLDQDIARQFAGQGLSALCIHVGEAAGLAALDPSGEIRLPCLVDPQGELFARVAMGTEYMPRIYLLDARRTVLWFDVEYSSATRRYLREAIEAALNGGTY